MSETLKSDHTSFLKLAAIQIGSGGSAGFIEVCIMHPLDLVKTRLQLQGSKPTNLNDFRYYTGIFDCFTKMRKHEGIFSYWKGIVPPILVETPKRAVKFFTFEQYKQFFLFGSPTATPLTFALAGLGAGITESILVNPFEVVKVQLQSNAAKGKDVPSTWAVTRRIIAAEGMGFKGINKGLTATICRNGSYNMIYFGNYHSVKNFFPAFEDPVMEFCRKLAIGFSSGIMGSLVNLPFDVAKSRIQGPQPTLGEIKYRSTTGTIVLIFKEEGWQALYKGLLPKLLRLGPGGAIMLVVYDYLHEYLTERFC